MILKRVVSLSSCDPVLLVQDFFLCLFLVAVVRKRLLSVHVSNSFGIAWTVTCQAPLYMGFSRQEYWSGLPFPTPADLPDSGIESVSPGSPALAGEFFTTEPSGKPFLGRETWIISYRQFGSAVVAAELGPVSCKKLVDEELSMRIL